MKNAGRELTITPDRSVVAVGNQIDTIINQCLPIATQQSQNFVQALTLANGIKALRQIILHDPHIKETITSMQNTNLGFMTDRTDLAVWKSKQGQGKELKPYRYEDVAEVCIEAMLKGYRITNNEFNMLVNRFYPAKNGKFRKIQEHEGLTDFQFTTTSPAYEAAQGGIQYAKVQCFASWRLNGTLVTLGSSTSAEDRLTFKIKVNKQMGEDAIVGKSLSKLFSRVLMRLDGRIMPESTDVGDDDMPDAEFSTADDLTEAIQKKAKVEEKEEKAPTEEKPDGVDAGAEIEPDFRNEWINKQGPGFSTYFHKNRAAFEGASIELQEEARVKWGKLYADTPWPLAPEIEDQQLSDEGQELNAVNAEINKYPLARVKEATKTLEYPDNRPLSLDESNMLLLECQRLTAGGGEDLA